MVRPTVLPPKKDVARALLLRGSVFVHLDPRHDGVMVPEWLRAQAQVVLQIGLDMPIAITDLRVDDAGVFGTLSFQRAPYTCTVPWAAVFALVGDDGKGMVWPDDLPPEIAAEVEREAQRARKSGVPSLPRAKKPGERRDRRDRPDGGPFGADPGDAPLTPAPAPAPAARLDDADAPADPAPSTTTGRKRRELPPYLRVIK